jgi:hypothetical protein
MAGTPHIPQHPSAENGARSRDRRGRGVPLRSRRVIQVTLSSLLVIGIFVLVFKRVDLASVWAVIRDMTWIELATSPRSRSGI